MSTTESMREVDDITVVVGRAELDLMQAELDGSTEFDGRTESSPPPGRTRLPVRDDAEIGPRRRVRQATAEDRFNLWGAFAAGASLALLLFGWFTPLTGQIGWAIVAFLAFIGFYALLVSLRSNGQGVADKVMTVLFVSAGILLFAALVFVVAYAIIRGWSALWHLNFFTQTMQFAGPLDPLTVGGILHAIVGTLIQISIALAITIPLGRHHRGLPQRGRRKVRPVRPHHRRRDDRASVDRGRPVRLHRHHHPRDASALGLCGLDGDHGDDAADRHPCVRRGAASGRREPARSLIRAGFHPMAHRLARRAADRAFRARHGRHPGYSARHRRDVAGAADRGVTAVLNFNPFSGPMISLPLQVFDFVKSPEPTMIARGFGAAAVLVILVLGLFVLARLIGGRGPGQLSDRQRRQRAEGSARDLRRITLAGNPPPLALPVAATSPPTAYPKETSS